MDDTQENAAYIYLSSEYTLDVPEYSDEWECYMFGGGRNGILWTPVKGREPNWFWRKMQFLFFGNEWVKKR